MDAKGACEALKLDRRQLAYPVKLGKIAVEGEGEAAGYSAEDVRHLAEQAALQPGRKLSKLPPRQVAFSSERVSQARRELIEALKDACLSGELTGMRPRGNSPSSPATF